MSVLKKTNSLSSLDSRKSSANSISSDDLESEIEGTRTERKMKRALDNFIVYYTRPEETGLIINDPESVEYINRLFYQIKHLIKKNKKSQLNVLDVLADEKLVKSFGNLLSCCFIYLKSLINKHKANTLNPSVHNKQNFQKVYDFLSLLVQLIWCLTNFSIKFRKSFHQNGVSKILIYILDDRKITDNFILFNVPNDHLFDYCDENYTLMKAIIGSLHNLTKTFQFEDNWNATKILINFVHKIKSSKSKLIQFNLISVYMTLSHILTDKEIDELSDIIEIVEKLVKIISQAATQIELGCECTRVKVDLENDKIESVCAITDENGIKWDLIELINGLYRIAVNDKIKHYIYMDCNLKDIIFKILVYGNLVEQEYALRILYQMCFDESICEIMAQDVNLIELIKLIIRRNGSNPNCVKMIEYCNGFNWVLENRLSKTDIFLRQSMAIEHSATLTPKTYVSFKKTLSESISSSQLESVQDGSINFTSRKIKLMISYNRENRDLCMSIKKCLEELNYQVWIDVEQIHGSSLEAMAKAIEESECIIICMTEKYKMSPNCRAEAEYTFNIRKKYIPLIMQADYKPDGWLGLILGAKIFVDFTKYKYPEAINRLASELKQELKTEIADTGTVMLSNSVKVSKEQINILISEWNCEKVNDWLTESKISENIKRKLEKFDGKMLNELNSIRNKAPEYFFASLRCNSTVDELFEVVNFSQKFTDLYS